MANGVANIAQVRALATPAKSYLWEFILPSVPGAAGAVPDAMTFRARATSWPARGVTTADSNFKGHTIKHPSKNNFTRTLQVTFEEGMNGVVIKAIRDWLNLWLDERDGSGNDESEVVVDAFVRLLNHSNEVVLQGHIYGLFVENMPDVPLDYASNEILKVPVTFGFSYWDLD